MKASSVLLALLPAAARALQSPLPPISGPRIFNITLTWEAHAPDGFTRQMILVNGQFPGPLMEMNQGDQVQVKVDNQTPFNTTMHFHGIEQFLTPWSDGVPGVSQRDISPGQTFQYEWTATQYGSYWYHSHYKGQLDDGMMGPILIHPRADLPTPFSLITGDAQTLHAIEQAARHVQPMFLSDLRHRTSMDAWSIVLDSGIDLPCFDSLLVNGQGQVDCWSAAKIASLVTPDQQSLMALGNISHLTAKACMPASIIASVLGRGFRSNVAVIPPDVFDVCTPTQGSYAVINVTKSSCESQKWLALDFVGAYGLLTTAVSIDGLPMWVYSVDGSYVVPRMVDAITITNGDRYGVLVQLTNPGDYTVRVASVSPTQLLSTHATISYRDNSSTAAPLAATNSTPYITEAGQSTSPSVVFFDETMQKAFPPSPVSQDVAQTHHLAMKLTGAGYAWALNETIFPDAVYDDTPLLFKPQPNAMNDYTITTDNNTWIDLILTTASLPMPAHPIHKHADKMYLLGQGTGAFPYATVADAVAAMPDQFNLVDPPKRDAFTTLPATRAPTWMVLRYHVTNPGAWLMHCHISSHLVGGMAMVIQDGIDHWPTVPEKYLSINA